jgi:hypothetical protein
MCFFSVPPGKCRNNNNTIRSLLFPSQTFQFICQSPYRSMPHSVRCWQRCRVNHIQISGLPKCSVPFRLSDQILVCISHLSLVGYFHWPYCPIWFNHSNNTKIKWRVPSMEPLVRCTQYWAISCYLSEFRSQVWSISIIPWWRVTHTKQQAYFNLSVFT